MKLVTISGGSRGGSMGSLKCRKERFWNPLRTDSYWFIVLLIQGSRTKSPSTKSRLFLNKHKTQERMETLCLAGRFGIKKVRNHAVGDQMASVQFDSLWDLELFASDASISTRTRGVISLRNRKHKCKRATRGSSVYTNSLSRVPLDK